MSHIHFTPEICEAHRMLSKWNVKFLEFLLENPEGLKRSHYDTLVNNPLFNRLQPWPTFISSEKKNELKKVCMTVFDLIKSIPGRVFNNDFDRIGQYYELPGNYCRLMLEGIDRSFLDGLVGRGDFILCPDRGIKCIEYNANANLGGVDQDYLEVMYLNIPTIAKFLTTNNLQIRRSYFLIKLLGHFLENAVAQSGFNSWSEINTALAVNNYSYAEYDAKYTEIKQVYNYVLSNLNSRLSGDLFFCDFNMLNLDNGIIYYNKKPVRIIIDWCMGKVPAWVMGPVKAGNLFLYNGPIMDILANKLSLALLSEMENSDIFNSGERENIKKYIPWTRKLIPGETTYDTNNGENIRGRLEDVVISYREQLVIKAGRSYGGKEVIMGMEVPPPQWKQLIEKAFAQKDWVVQEYIKPYSLLYQFGESGYVPHQVVWGVFSFGTQSPGGFVRVLPEKNQHHVININQGAEQSFTLELAE